MEKESWSNQRGRGRSLFGVRWMSGGKRSRGVAAYGWVRSWRVYRGEDFGRKKRAHWSVPAGKVTRTKPACAALAIWLGRLCSGAFGETGDGFGFGVVDIEDGQQLGDLEHFLELAAQVAEAQGGALCLHAVMGGDERTEPGTVDKSDVVHVEDNFLFSFCHQAFYFFAQAVAFLAEHNAAVQCHHGHAIHFAIGHLQSHVIILLVGKRFRRQPEPQP